MTEGVYEEVTALARRHRELGEVIAELDQQRAELKARFEALVPVGFETEVDGKPVFHRGPNRSFNLRAALDLAVRLAIPVRIVETPDVDDLKARLKAAGQLDEAMLPGAGSNRSQL